MGRPDRNWCCLPQGRDFTARLGPVPKQLSTGDRTILGRTSRHGNRCCANTVRPAGQCRTSNAKPGPSTVSELDRNQSSSGFTQMYWLLPWQQNWLAWPSACSQRSMTTTPISWVAPPLAGREKAPRSNQGYENPPIRKLNAEILKSGRSCFM